MVLRHVLLRPACLYKAAAMDVLLALWQSRVHENPVRGNVIPSTCLYAPVLVLSYSAPRRPRPASTTAHVRSRTHTHTHTRARARMYTRCSWLGEAYVDRPAVLAVLSLSEIQLLNTVVEGRQHRVICIEESSSSHTTTHCCTQQQPKESQWKQHSSNQTAPLLKA